MAIPDLPEDILLEITKYLGITDGIALIQVNRTFRAVVSYKAFWESILNAARAKGIPLACPSHSNFSEYDLDELRSLALRAAAVRRVFVRRGTKNEVGVVGRLGSLARRAFTIGGAKPGILLKETIHKRLPGLLLCTLPGKANIALLYTLGQGYIAVKCHNLQTGRNMVSINLHATRIHAYLAAPVCETDNGDYLVPLWLESITHAEMFVLRITSSWTMKVQVHIPNLQLRRPCLSSELLVRHGAFGDKLALFVLAHDSGRATSIITDIPFSYYETHVDRTFLTFFTSTGDLVLVAAFVNGFKWIKVPRSELPYKDNLSVQKDYHYVSEFLPKSGSGISDVLTSCRASDGTTFVTYFSVNPLKIQLLQFSGSLFFRADSPVTFPESSQLVLSNQQGPPVQLAASSPYQTAHLLQPVTSLQLVWWDLEADIPTLYRQGLHIPHDSNVGQPWKFFIDDAQGEILMLKEFGIWDSELWGYSFI